MKGMRELAKEAKNRLKGGYWTDYLEKRESDIECAKERGISEEFVKMNYKRKVADSFETKSTAESDAELYRKVYEIVVSEEIVTNPLGRLIDEERFALLDQFGKQLYILKLSEAYLRIKKKILDEIQYELTLKK